MSASAELVPLRWWQLPEVCRLETELFGDEQWSPEAFWSELSLCPPTLLDGPVRRYWAACDSAGVAGYAGLAVSGDESYVQTIGVAGRAQRRGVGGRLLARLLENAAELGAATCWLEVRADNEPAQQMYRRFGFVRRGLRRGYYQPSGTDAVVMAVGLPVAGEGTRG